MSDVERYKITRDFAEWLGKNHFRMVNVSKGYSFWSSESFDNGKEYETNELITFFLYKRHEIL